MYEWIVWYGEDYWYLEFGLDFIVYINCFEIYLDENLLFDN